MSDKQHDERRQPVYVYSCVICGIAVPDYVPEFCCSGAECGCMGMPTEPPVCSDTCWDRMDEGIGKPMEER